MVVGKWSIQAPSWLTAFKREPRTGQDLARRLRQVEEYRHVELHENLLHQPSGRCSGDASHSP